MAQSAPIPLASTDPGAQALLERSAELAALSEALAAVTATGEGRLVLISGEAGIGKTALVQEFTAGLDGVRRLSGACEALTTPRPLGPLHDIAAETAGALAAALERGASPGEALTPLLAELRSPTVLVLEDLHWADEATLDVLRLLGRRVASVPALVIGTHRDVGAADPLRVALGDLPSRAVTRIPLRSLSPDAVATLARPHGVDARGLFERTAGNPFYVTEALAAGGALPDSVRDAVHARAARLREDARRLLDAVAIAPPRAELWLLEAVAGEDLSALDACIAAGMLHAERRRVAFRHEIARVAIEEAMAPDRRLALNRRALPALAARTYDLARLAHHAEAAGDGAAVLRYAPAAGDRAAALGAHREAAEQFARALRFGDRLPGEKRADLLERRSFECYLTDALDEAIDARRQALAIHHARFDRCARATRTAGSRACPGSRATTRPPRPRASGRSRCWPGCRRARSWRWPTATWRSCGCSPATSRDPPLGRAGDRARRAAQPARDAHPRAQQRRHRRADRGRAGGREKLERSLALALEAGLEEHVARAYTNLATTRIPRREYAVGDPFLEAGLEYCRGRDIDAWVLYMSGWLARSRLEQGRWEEAGELARFVVGHPGVAATSKITALVVLGTLRARRGEPGVWEPLDEARALAMVTMEPQRVVPVAAARAEARLLAGEPERVAEELGDALALTASHGQGWAAGELCLLGRRAGLDLVPPVEPADPYRLELAGEHEAAAKAWRALGCPYEAALAELAAGNENARTELRALGARCEG